MRKLLWILGWIVLAYGIIGTIYRIVLNPSRYLSYEWPMTVFLVVAGLCLVLIFKSKQKES